MKVIVEGNEYNIKKKKTIESFLKEIDISEKSLIVAAIVNNKILDLNSKLTTDSKIKFVKRGDVLGNRIYRRSLFLVMAKAIYQLYPDSYLSIEHSLSEGIYCELYKNNSLFQEDIENIKKIMKEIVEKNLSISKKIVSKQKAIAIFNEQKFWDKIKLLKQTNFDKVPLYELDGYYDYFYYNMVPRTGYLDKFEFHFSFPGFILLFPQKNNPDRVPEFTDQPKLSKIFRKYGKLADILEVSRAADLNEKIKSNNYSEIIRIAEGLHEKNIANIADEIYKNITTKKIILIAGPSASGKTTFTQRLSTQLKINGLNPVTISIDDYFVNRENTPLDEDGNPDYESIKAVDIDLLNRHLVKLLQGKTVEIPEFNFQKGKKEYTGQELQPEHDQPILLEGIHGLNDRLTEVIPVEQKYKIYVSALTQINIDRHNRIPTTDTRKIRRIIRDHKYRNHSAAETIRLWPNIRKGEDKNIFPYQENADIMFNSALIYEMSVLKEFAIPILQEIDEAQDPYYEAQRLIELLQCFKSIPVDEIPNNSIIKEFIGGSVFRR